MRPQLSAHEAHLHHLILLDAEVTPEDVEALARSHYPHAGWVDTDTIALEHEVSLTGPWAVPAKIAAQLGAPGWVAQAVVVLCPQERLGEVPESLRGVDEIADAYPYATPQGIELETLQFARAAARRLAGALHLAGTAVTIQPDSDESIDLVVYAPIYLRGDQALALVSGGDLDGMTRKTWSISLPARAGAIQVMANLHPVAPIVLAAFEWAGLSVRGYEVRWHAPEDWLGRELTRAEREVRTEVAGAIETIAGRIAELTNGVCVDDDGFLVAL